MDIVSFRLLWETTFFKPVLGLFFFFFLNEAPDQSVTDASEPLNVQTFLHNGSIVLLHIGQGDVNT